MLLLAPVYQMAKQEDDTQGLHTYLPSISKVAATGAICHKGRRALRPGAGLCSWLHLGALQYVSSITCSTARENVISEIWYTAPGISRLIPRSIRDHPIPTIYRHGHLYSIGEGVVSPSSRKIVKCHISKEVEGLHVALA
nr:hypothetical protein CFP56_63339 [Quercus suber]